jgi:hypothetical protein
VRLDDLDGCSGAPNRRAYPRHRAAMTQQQRETHQPLQDPMVFYVAEFRSSHRISRAAKAKPDSPKN